MKTKNIAAQAASPARCHILGRTEASTHRPSIAVMDVNREIIRPTNMGYCGNQMTSGIIAAVNTRTAQSSSGVRNAHGDGVVFHSRISPYRKHKLPKISTTQASLM